MDSDAGQSYWDRHVTASNLPGEDTLTAEGWKEAIAFYLTPEQSAAYDALGPLPALRVIEIGCGVGVNAINLAGRGATVAAVDASHPRLLALRRVAAEKGVGDRVWAVCARAEQLPFRRDAFDRAYSKSSLIHTDLPAAAAECRRVLKRGGRGVFCEPTASNPPARFYRRWLGPKEWKDITHYFTRAEEKTLAAAFGNLAVSSFYLFAFAAFYWQFGRRNLKRFRRWLALLNGLDRVLFAVCPVLRRWAWFRVYVVDKTE
ncbi:MAG: class I SAM-dependent methyltransferase [Candidatus Sumerlaeia bacterium]|nr:class I SAM-dependent methyltransferase [Candidatus Sumerlaeia bacterium]